MKSSRNFSRRSALYAVIATTSGLVLSPLHAQESRLMLDEVIVTAQKREQSIQDVPVSVTAIAAEMIEQAGIQTTEDIVRVAPSLTFTGNTDKQAQAFSVRGIGTSVFGINTEQSVAFIVDDVATVQPGESIENLSDVERIEVLRGPQSTLFGKSASAGAIVVTTRAPSEQSEAALESTVTNDEEYRLSGSASGPLGESFGYRMSGYWTDREGYIDNLYNDHELNGTENHGLRGKLRWDASESIDATLTAYYNKDDDTCCVLTARELSPDALLFGALPLNRNGIDVGDDNDRVRMDIDFEGQTETTGGNLRVNIGAGEHTLVSITAINDWQYDNAIDVDGWDIDIAALVGAGHGGMYQVSEMDSDFFSQEFRLLSPADAKLEYLAGLYYADSESERYHERNVEPALPFAQAHANSAAGTETSAVFGQATWHFTEATSVTAGLRYHYEEISGEYTDLLTDAGTIRGDDDDSKVVGRITLQQMLGEDTMVFASYATGYKGQAFDVTTGFDETKAENPVAPETSESIELGMKGTFWDRRLRLNATLFQTGFEDYQAQSIVLEGFGDARFDLVNVGKLETAGAEIESTVLLMESLTVTLNAAYIDAEVNDYTGANCWPGQTLAQGCTGDYQNIDGGELPSAPQWKYGLFLEYEHDLDGVPFDAFAGFNYSWQDDVIFDINQDPDLYQDAYGIANLRVGIVDDDSHYQVAAFVNNLFDEQYASGMRNGSLLYDGAPAYSQMLARNAFRYWGLTAKYQFR